MAKLNKRGVYITYLKTTTYHRYGGAMVPVFVEASVSSRGLPYFDIIGLPGKTLDESRQRVKSAIISCGFEFPRHRILINLTPVDIPKEGAYFDFAISAIFIAKMLEFDISPAWAFAGEVSLDGRYRHTPQVVPSVFAGVHNQIKTFFVPAESQDTLSNLPQNPFLSIVLVKDVRELFNIFVHWKNNHSFPVQNVLKISDYVNVSKSKNFNDFDDIKGLYRAKRAVQISLLGNHHMLLSGSPGVGKTSLLKSARLLLPKLSAKDIYETSIFNNLERPFRFPHHTISSAGLLGGGGVNPKPGEVTLAHKGVLFLDEFTEFNRQALEALRQPLEEGCVYVSRGNNVSKFPAAFILWAAVNPCPCGYYGHELIACKCTPSIRAKYANKLSGPIVDRIDIHVQINTADIEDTRQLRGEMVYESLLNVSHDKELPLSTSAENLVTALTLKYKFSMRRYKKLLSVAKTIASIDRVEKIEANHIAESATFMPIDTQKY